MAKSRRHTPGYTTSAGYTGYTDHTGKQCMV